MKILVSPYSRALRNGERNPKNYPEWNMLAQLMKNEGWQMYQYTVDGEYRIHPDVIMLRPTKLDDIRKTLHIYDTFVSVDNFFPHLAAYYNLPGFVLWGKSDPEIFGHEIHTNILRDRSFLRPDQFRIWEQTEYNEAAFCHPSIAMSMMKRKLKELKKI